MDRNIVRQIRILQMLVCFLLFTVVLLLVNCVHPLLGTQRVHILEAERINIREHDGVLKAALSNAAGFREGDRAKGTEAPRFSGLVFYNEEGQEEGGLVYQGKAVPGGQDADVSLTMDQYRQDQNIYLNHTEHKDAEGSKIQDGLTVNERPDWTATKTEYALYGQMQTMNASQRDLAELQARREGKISVRRLFVGVRRGSEKGVGYDDAGIFIRNRLGKEAIRIYVDANNQPHFEVYDELGKSKVYELKLDAVK